MNLFTYFQSKPLLRLLTTTDHGQKMNIPQAAANVS